VCAPVHGVAQQLQSLSAAHLGVLFADTPVENKKGGQTTDAFERKAAQKISR